MEVNTISSIKDILETQTKKQMEVIEKRAEKRKKTNEQKVEITRERKEAEIANMSDKERWEYMVEQRKLKIAMKRAKEAYYKPKRKKQTSRQRMEEKKLA